MCAYMCVGVEGFSMGVCVAVGVDMYTNMCISVWRPEVTIEYNPATLFFETRSLA